MLIDIRDAHAEYLLMINSLAPLMRSLHALSTISPLLVPGERIYFVLYPGQALRLMRSDAASSASRHDAEARIFNWMADFTPGT